MCFFFLFSSEWYTNGDYLVLLVSLFIILPLSLLRNLGQYQYQIEEIKSPVYNLFFFFLKSVISFASLGYLGYTSGLSLLCMVFFLIVVSRKRNVSPFRGNHIFCFRAGNHINKSVIYDYDSHTKWL